MAPQDVVLDRVAVGVEDDAVDGVAGEWIQIGRGHLVGFDQPQVELDVGGQTRVAGQDGEGLAVRAPGPSASCGAFRAGRRPWPTA